MKLKAIRPSLIVRVIACVTCLGFWFFLRSNFDNKLVESPEWWGVCAISLLSFVATSRKRWTRLAWGAAAVSCIAITGWKSAYFFPLEQRVEAMSLVDTPLPDVLQTLSRQRRIKPYRRFIIHDSASLERRLTVTIPAGSTFGEAMRQIADAAGCDFDWHWYSWCGNTYPPTTTIVSFSARGTKPRTRGIWEFDRNRLWLRDENGVPMTNNDGVPVASTASASSIAKTQPTSGSQSQ